MLSQNKLAVIHIAKSSLKLSDEDYKAILSGFGVESSKELDDNQFKLMMKTFEDMGYKAPVKKEIKKDNQVWGCTPKQKAMIQAIWIEKARDKSSTALSNFIFRIVKKSTAFLGHRDVEKILKALEGMK